MSLEKVAEFFEYARKREQIRLDKEAGWPQEEWTDDPILKQYRFCNIFREDDKTTKWFKENIREYLSNDIDAIGPGYAQNGALLFATVAFRWFNRIATADKIKYELLAGTKKWDPVKIHNKLSNEKPLVTGAYMIKTPTGMNKLKGILWCLDQFLPQADYNGYLIQNNKLTLEQAHKLIGHFPFLGDFMAYEIVTDLRHTPLLRDAKDINTWANPGPGAARGLCRILEEPLDYYDRNSKADCAAMVQDMQEILARSKQYWPWHKTRPWEMREVEHTLCEFDKYERARLGEGRPKQKYKPGE